MRGGEVQDPASRSSSRPISSETGSGRFVGGRSAARSAAVTPALTRSSGLAARMRISPVKS